MSNPPNGPEDQEGVRVTANLSLGHLEVLRELASAQNITLEDALKRAIATEGLLQKKIQGNNRVLLQAEDGRISELVFKK